MTVYGDGSQTRSFCYVSDEIEGLVKLAHSNEHDPKNIGNPREFTVLECAQLVLKLTGSSSRIAFEPLPVDDPKQRCPDLSKARKLLNWEPKIDLETGLRLSIDYYRGSLSARPDKEQPAIGTFSTIGTNQQELAPELPLA